MLAISKDTKDTRLFLLYFVVCLENVFCFFPFTDYCISFIIACRDIVL